MPDLLCALLTEPSWAKMRRTKNISGWTTSGLKSSLRLSCFWRAYIKGKIYFFAVEDDALRDYCFWDVLITDVDVDLRRSLLFKDNFFWDRILFKFLIVRFLWDYWVFSSRVCFNYLRLSDWTKKEFLPAMLVLDVSFSVLMHSWLSYSWFISCIVKIISIFISN